MSSFDEAIAQGEREYALEREETDRLEELERLKPLTVCQLGDEVTFWEHQLELSKEQIASLPENLVGETASYAKYLRKTKRKLYKNTKSNLKKARKALNRATSGSESNATVEVHGAVPFLFDSAKSDEAAAAAPTATDGHEPAVKKRNKDKKTKKKMARKTSKK
jgi:hypothetical protein